MHDTPKNNGLRTGRSNIPCAVLWGALGILVGVLVVTPTIYAGDAPYPLTIPLGLDEDSVMIPKDNPLTTAKVNLGKLLFFDNRLSKNNTIACASCHVPSLAFTDGQPVSAGIHRQQGTRSAPASFNRLFSSAQFWDGRAATLEDQSVGPFVNPVEHGFANHDELIAKIQTISGYAPLFKGAFGSDTITVGMVGKAIASFQRTVLSGNSPFDRFTIEGNTEAISRKAQQGRALFFAKARCLQCHFGSNFTDEQFHNLGIDWDTDRVDLGRFKVTNDPKDIGAFKTPTLREISRTAPYMHDGRFARLEDVVEFYDQGGIPNPHKDFLILPLQLTKQEKFNLVEFLRTLSGEGWDVQPPTHFPQ